MTSKDLKIGDMVTFTMYEHLPTLSVAAKGKVVGIPTSEAMQGTIKVLVLEIMGDAKKRRFYRDLVGKHVRRPVESLKE